MIDEDLYRVPVDQRVLGLDKRSLRPGLVVLAIVVVFIGIVPLINNGISWTDQTTAGDVIVMSGGITFAPPDGWSLTDGVRSASSGRPAPNGKSTAELVNGGVSIDVRSGGYDASVDSLLVQVNDQLSRSDGSEFQVLAGRTSVATQDGHTGVSELYRSPAHDGQLAAFTFVKSGPVTQPTGLTFVISGPTGSLTNYRVAIEAMLTSVSVGSAS